MIFNAIKKWTCAGALKLFKCKYAFRLNAVDKSHQVGRGRLLRNTGRLNIKLSIVIFGITKLARRHEAVGQP